MSVSSEGEKVKPLKKRYCYSKKIWLNDSLKMWFNGSLKQSEAELTWHKCHKFILVARGAVMQGRRGMLCFGTDVIRIYCLGTLSFVIKIIRTIYWLMKYWIYHFSNPKG